MRKLLVIVLFLATALEVRSQAVINGGTVYQTIDGFGGENGGPWSWASAPYNWNALDSTTATTMFSTTTGIGISIYRTDSIDGAANATLPDLASIQSAVALGAQVELAIQSPPSSMKYSGNYLNGTINPSTGTSCLSTGTSYATYAAYVVGVIQNLAASGITVAYLDVANEPNAPSGSTTVTGFGTCGWTAAGLDAFVKVLGPALATAGFTPKVMIASAFNYANSPNYFGTCLADSACNAYIGIYSGHGYGYPDTPVAPGTGGYPSISSDHLWLSETGDQGSYDPNMDSALTMAANMQAFLQTGQVSAYEWWELGYINSGGSCTNCNLIATNSDGSNTYTKRFYAFGNFSKFVRPGWVMISSTYQPQANVVVSAFKNPSNGSYVIIAVNYNSSSVSQSFSLSGLTATEVTPYITDPSNNVAVQSPISISASSFTASLNAQSVTTFVSSSSTYTLSTSTTGTGSGTLGPCSGTYTAGASYTCPVSAAPGSVLVGTPVGCGGTLSGSNYSGVMPANSCGIVATFNVSGGGTTIAANSCSVADIQTALNSVTASTTLVTIPSGVCAWTSGATFNVPSGNANLTIAGNTAVNCTGTPGTSSYTCAAVDNTVIQDDWNNVGQALLAITTGNTASFFRLTGITFEGGTATQSKYGLVTIGGNTQNLRIDHIHLNSNTYTGSVNTGWFRIAGANEGVIDHNLGDLAPCNGSSGSTCNNFVSNAFQAFNDIGDSVGLGDGAFASPTGFGTSEFLFIESNVFNGGLPNDCNFAGRFVMRYNTINDAYAGIQTHDTKTEGGPQRGCRGYEAYDNYFTGPTATPASGATSSKGAPSLIYNNILASGYARFFEAGTDRNSGAAAETNNPNGWGYCSTTTNSNGVGSGWDGNQPTIATGYPCLDQVGRGQTAQVLNGQVFPNRLNSATGTIAWPQQLLEPAYLWNNNIGSAQYVRIVDNVTNNNRDYYYDASSANSGCAGSFNGSCGTGFGSLASRPTTCTPGSGGVYAASPGGGSFGVAYWASDANSGAGELYVCSALNVWNPIYSPYIYPHPLVSGGGLGLTINFAGTGSGTSNCTSGLYLAGPMSCSGTPGAGSTLTSVSGTGDASACAASPCSFSLSTGATITFNFSSSTAAAPTFSPISGTYASGTTITISSTSGCDGHIYYGNVNPPTTSNTQGSSFSLSSSLTVYAKVISCPGFSDSTVNSATYNLLAPSAPSAIRAVVSIP